MLGTDNGRIRCRIPSTDSGKSALAGTGHGEAACAGGLDTPVWGPGRAYGLLAATVLLLAFASGARTCLALAGGALMRGRAAGLRRRTTLRIAGRCARGRLRSRAPGTRVRAAARGLRCGAATLVGLLIHHGPLRLRTGVVSHRRALRLWRPVRLRAGDAVSHRRALRLWRPVRLRAGGPVTHRRTLRLLRPIAAVRSLAFGWRRSAAGRRSPMRAASCRPAPSVRAPAARE